MNLRRLRIIVTALSGLVTLVAVVALSRLAVDYGNRRIEAETRHAAEAHVSDALLMLHDGVEPKEIPVWFIGGDGQVKAYSTSTLSPPFNLLIPRHPDGSTSGSVTYETFSQGGESYLGFGQPTANNEALVGVESLTGSADERSSLRLRIGLGAGALVVGSCIASWFVAGRALRPARQALSERRGFLADAAHEMRTPLAVILASASQALSRPRERDEYVRSLAEIRSAAERASLGVSELLDLARLESGQAIPRLAPLRLDLLAEEVAVAVRADDCTITADPGTAIVVDADMALLRQAVDNVVRNAARRAQQVSLTTGIDGRDGLLTVLDDGPGFDPAVLPTVFDRYTRGDRRGEVGIGLTLVKAILAAHGGAVTAANRPEGGASVTLRVPLARGQLG